MMDQCIILSTSCHMNNHSVFNFYCGKFVNYDVMSCGAHVHGSHDKNWGEVI